MNKVDQHRIYIITNDRDEAYIMVRKQYATLEWFVDQAFQGTEQYEKDNPVLNRFLRESTGLGIERVEAPAELTNLREVLDYREQIIAQYHADGYLVMDEKHYKMLEAPADTNFGEVLKKIDIGVANKKYGTKALIKARKTLTVGEFIAQFG